MTNGDNPYGKPDNYGAGAAQYTTKVDFGGETPASAPVSAPGAPAGQGFSLSDSPQTPAADLIKDTTTAGFTADVIQESRNQPVLVDF
jgi:putative thioredoxin